jgi:ferritin-like metal-binding protein YciE
METNVTKPEERLMDWLRDAHAMEEQAETMLSSQIARLKHYPEVKSKMQQHLTETKRQSTLISGCIERRGGDTSAMKDMTAKMVAAAQGLSGMFVGDEVIKGALASYSFEQMEIASYRILIAAAEAIGDSETAAICKEILSEEEAMASWIQDNTPTLVRKYLKLDLTPGVEAKR